MQVPVNFEYKRPRRHVLADNFFEHVNFAYDETKHVTRILQEIEPCAANNEFVSYDSLYSTKSILNKCVQKYKPAFKVVAEAVLDIRSISHRDWWTIASDICCVFDRTTNRLFYTPVSAINAQYKQHTIASLDLFNYSCLAQIWVRNSDDLVCDCAMSYTTHYSDKHGLFCAFPLGEMCTQSDINANSMASKHLNLSFKMQISGIEDIIVETLQGRVTSCIVDYRNKPLEVIISAFNYATGESCLDASGELELQYDNCSISSNRIIMHHGIAKFYIAPYSLTDLFEKKEQCARVILNLHGSTPARLHCTFRI